MTRNKMSRLVTACGAMVLASMLTAATANAAVITFDNSGMASGNIAYNGTGGPATGTDITFDIVTFESLILDCNDCMLDFVTGNNTFESPALATFDGGGSFVITGTITDPTNGNALVASGVLLSGTFSGPLPGLAITQEGGRVTVTGAGIDEKNADLLAYLGLADTSFVYASTNISATGCDGNLTNGFNCRVVEADVVNTSVEEVPEPGTLALFGLGLLAAGSATRRWTRR